MTWLRESTPDTTPWEPGFPGADPLNFPIDSNGSLTTKTEGTTRNQLTRVTKNTVEQARFSYDPTGRRVEKVSGGITTTYKYDKEDILREVRVSGLSHLPCISVLT